MAERRIVSFRNSEEEAYISRVRQWWGERPHTYFTETYGCQMNVRDSQTISGFLEAMGYTPAADKESADFVIFNTCCVREGAEDRLMGNLGKLKQGKKADPDKLIAVGGCMVQQPGKGENLRKRFRFVDIVLGTHNLHRLPYLVYEALCKKTSVCEVWDRERDIVEGMPVLREKSFSAWVNIMFGCNNFCSYCIVPYVRGRERSRRSEDIINEVRGLTQSGVKEITLLGQNVNSYGKEIGEISFPDLLRRLDTVEGLERLRFMTSHPKDLSDDLIAAMRDCRHVCHYLHLPVQSGSDRILKLMNRRYTRDDYFKLVEKLRAAMPDLAISTDLIVGFPGETEQDFCDTLDLYENVCFNSSFTFIYSPREGTPAARMTEQVPPEVSSERIGRLIQCSEACTLKAGQSYLGKTYPVLVEGMGRHEDGLVAGRTESGRMVCFPGDASLIGQTVDVTIRQIRLSAFYGERKI